MTKEEPKLCLKKKVGWDNYLYICPTHLSCKRLKKRRKRNREGLRTNGVLFICLGLKHVDNPKRRAKGKKTKDANMS